MPALKRIRWAATGAAAAMVVAAVLVTLTAKTTVRQPAALAPAPLAAGDPLYGGRPLPAIPLVDEDGRRTSLSAFRGRVLVFAPSMTLCKEVCPMTTGVLTDLAARLRSEGLASRVAVAEVTVDPWRDSPARLRAYKRLTGADFTMLTGSVPSITRLWKRLGVYFKRVPQGNPPAVDWLTHRSETFDVAHTDGLFVLDQAGTERIVVGGMPQVKGPLSSTLRRLLDAEGRQNLAHPQEPWTAPQVLDDVDWLLGREVPTSSLRSTPPPSAEDARRQLAGSPSALASLHAQAGRLLGSGVGLRRRLRGLRGYPVVLNVWASWCPACKAEFPLLAAASASYGRRVAFLGYDANDVAGKARQFLASHHVSYPSYQGESGDISSLASLSGMPDTLFIGPDGKVRYVHVGEYGTEGTLLADIERYALRS
jgi:cytochrome oxidase Cu insertion factor (SCO1/SenC/PrrC family)/thiol-disulfide isomerase/thioredoxin